MGNIDVGKNMIVLVDRIVKAGNFARFTCLVFHLSFEPMLAGNVLSNNIFHFIAAGKIQDERTPAPKFGFLI